MRAVLPGIEFANLFKSDEYGVLARHGHEWDENCHGFTFYNKVLRPDGAPQLGRFDARSYQIMAIGEVVTAELMSGLVHFARAAQPGNVPDFPSSSRRSRTSTTSGPLSMCSPGSSGSPAISSPATSRRCTRR